MSGETILIFILNIKLDNRNKAVVLHGAPSKLKGWVENTDKKKHHHCLCKRNTEETCLKHS